MVIKLLALTSVVCVVLGAYGYRRGLTDPRNDAMGRAMSPWVLVAWAAIGFVPAVGAAALVAAWYPRLDRLTRVVGLAPAGVLAVLLVPLGCAWVCAFVVAPLVERFARRRRGR